MRDMASALALLQFGDSFFPSGSVSFSWGLEGLAESGAVTSAELATSFVLGQLHARWGPFDRVALVAAHRAGADLERIAAIDDHVEVQTASHELRSGSRRMGEAMLSVFGRLDVEGVAAYRDLIKRRLAYGHLGPMQGFLWARVGLDEGDAVALSAHTFCTGLLGAAIRLGCLGHIDAQRALIEARREAASIAKSAPPPLTEMSSFALEAEIAVMRHASNTLRVFAN